MYGQLKRNIENNLATISPSILKTKPGRGQDKFRIRAGPTPTQEASRLALSSRTIPLPQFSNAYAMQMKCTNFTANQLITLEPSLEKEKYDNRNVLRKRLIIG